MTNDAAGTTTAMAPTPEGPGPPKRGGGSGATRRRRGIRNRIIGYRLVPANELIEHPDNWRRHPSKQRRAMSGSFAEIGYADALIARQTPEGLILIDGHLRRSITPDQEVPVLVVDLDEQEAALLLASLDPLAAMAEADREAYGSLLSRIETTRASVRDMLEDFRRSVGAALPGRTHPDAIPASRPPARVAPGERWSLGEHRLLCGDATSGEDVERLLRGERPDVCVTDPPYGVDYDPAWRERAAEQGRLAYAARRTGGVRGDDRADWREAFELYPGDVLYAWHAGIRGAEVQTGIEAAGFEVRSQIIWAKPHLPIGRGHYHWRHEPCFYAVRRGRSAQWAGGRKQSTLWEMALDPAAGTHGTQKPVEAMERPIRNHGARIVYDPFVGSGTTFIAAERAGVRCLGIDIDPAWCDLALLRWESFTGRRARRLR